MEPGTPDALQDGRFLLLEAIGRGGMGSVYRAFDRSEERVVALKVARDSVRAGPAHPLSGEFDTWSRLRHPNIVEAYELGLARRGPIPAERPYLVLEHVAGGPANRALRPGRIDAATTESLARQVLRALDHVHASGYVHRDLKPDNVLIEAARGKLPRCKLTDFGLAKRVGSAGAAGTVSGSLAYVSPEALLGLPVDARSDLYGLGILLYQLATGELPVKLFSAEAILRWHLTGPPADPSRLRPRIPDRFARFIRRLTERDRTARPGSAAEALEILGGAGGPAAGPRLRGGVDRALLAELRLALDAVRLGQARVFRLPQDSGQAEALRREVAIWSQVRGLDFHRLRRADPCCPGGLAALVLRLLLERRRDAPGCLRRYRLGKALPLALLGGRPLLDPSARALCPRLGPAARDVAAFLASCARARAMVLSVEGAALGDPLTRALVAALADERDSRVLLILDSAGPPRVRERRAGSRAARPRRDASTAPPCSGA